MILTAGPAHLAGVVVIQLCFAGSQESGAEYVQAISSWEEERCLFKDVRERDFLEQQDSVANILKGGAGRKWRVIKAYALHTALTCKHPLLGSSNLICSIRCQTT